VTEQSSAQEPSFRAKRELPSLRAISARRNLSSISHVGRRSQDTPCPHYKSVARRPYFTCPSLIYRKQSGTSAPAVTAISANKRVSAIVFASIASPRKTAAVQERTRPHLTLREARANTGNSRCYSDLIPRYFAVNHQSIDASHALPETLPGSIDPCPHRGRAHTGSRPTPLPGNTSPAANTTGLPPRSPRTFARPSQIAPAARPPDTPNSTPSQ
jgi:hypothetical protein